MQTEVICSTQGNWRPPSTHMALPTHSVPKMEKIQLLDKQSSLRNSKKYEPKKSDWMEAMKKLKKELTEEIKQLHQMHSLLLADVTEIKKQVGLKTPTVKAKARQTHMETENPKTRNSKSKDLKDESFISKTELVKPWLQEAFT